nr:uncharacterized protein LOC703642 [Macaca mulatta]
MLAMTRTKPLALFCEAEGEVADQGKPSDSSGHRTLSPAPADRPAECSPKGLSPVPHCPAYSATCSKGPVLPCSLSLSSWARLSGACQFPDRLLGFGITSSGHSLFSLLGISQGDSPDKPAFWGVSVCWKTRRHPGDQRKTAGAGRSPGLRAQWSTPALCSASEEPMAQPLCTLLLLLAALAGSQAWSPEEEDRVIPGSIYDADLNDEWVQHALHFAISEYNKATEDEYYRRPLRVLRAREQVVAGMNYFLDVELGRTTCTKSQPNLDTCAFHEQPELQKKQLCSFQIYEVPWEDKMSLVNSRCQEA